MSTQSSLSSAALEAFSRHFVVKRTDAPGSVLTVAEFLRHVRRMVVAFVVNRLFAVQGEATVTLDDPTTYYLRYRNDFGLGDAPELAKPGTDERATLEYIQNHLAADGGVVVARQRGLLEG